jgi:hypothetical protein
MSRRLSSGKEQRLGERLRQESIDTWPAYSEALHDRIVSAIEQTKSEPVMPNRRSTDVRLRGRWMAALAAACLVGVVVFGWQSAQRESDQGGDLLANASSQFSDELPRIAVAETLMPGAPLIDEWTDKSVEDLGGLAISAAIAPHSEGLEHDTRLAAETLLERLPVDMEVFAGPGR